MVIHDFAYADIVFDGYQAPSFLQAKGAKDVGVEFFSMSKSYSMPGWRVGFCVGNEDTIFALKRIKIWITVFFNPFRSHRLSPSTNPRTVSKRYARHTGTAGMRSSMG